MVGTEVIGRVRSKTPEGISKEKARLKAMVRALIPESFDTYDVEAKYDASLTYMENKTAIIDDLRKLFAGEFKGITPNEQLERAKADQERFMKERDDAIEDEILQYNQRSYVDSLQLDEFYIPVHRAITKLCQGYSNLAFIKGRGGVGKSWNIRKILLKNKVKFREVAGDVTEAYLYRLLYEHNDEIIWFRETSKLLAGLKSINLIKSATETESERLLTKDSYSKSQDDLPDRFIYRGKIIFDYNEIVGMVLKDDFEALQTRGDFIELSFSMEDIKAIMRLIAPDGWQNEVTEALIASYEFTGQNLLNLRTQWKAFKTYEYCQKNNLDWKEELKAELKSSISRVRAMLYSLIGTKAVRTTELKKLLLKYEAVGTERTGARKILEWLLTEELFKVSAEEREFFICINPLDLGSAKQYQI
jgi:hypothetical protein